MPTTESLQSSVYHAPQQDKFAFLQTITGIQKHSQKTFYQHLVNVYTYLKTHGALDEVCDAGLFHSIYGTTLYEFHDERVNRDVVRGLIGDYAEHLVYVFCKAEDRFNTIVNNLLGLSDREARDLCLIEFANKWDQNKGGKYQRQMILLAEEIVRLENNGQQDSEHQSPLHTVTTD